MTNLQGEAIHIQRIQSHRQSVIENFLSQLCLGLLEFILCRDFCIENCCCEVIQIIFQCNIYIYIYIFYFIFFFFLKEREKGQERRLS